MRTRARTARFLAFILLAGTLFALPLCAGAQTPAALLICTAEEAETLSGLLDACRADFTLIVQADYTRDALAGADKVITTLPETAKDAMAAGAVPLCLGDACARQTEVTLTHAQNASVHASYNGLTQTARFEKTLPYISAFEGETLGTLELETVGSRPFAALGESAWYVPWYKKDDFTFLMLGEVVCRYLDTGDTGSMYVVMDEIYPFSDFEALRRSADALYENAIPFIARVMPVYDNLEYPAFSRYADTLLYLQSKNGAIVVHDSVIFNTLPGNVDQDKLARELDGFYTRLTSMHIRRCPMQRAPLLLSPALLSAVSGEGKRFGSFAVDTMIPFTPGGEESVDAQIQTLNARWLEVANYALQDSYARPAYAAVPMPEAYDYLQDTEEARTLTGFFTVGNSVLVTVVAVSLTVFAVLIIWGYKLYKRKFMG
ncbi:MAG: DUF2334 domain-containing protein [Eubacteriales bacterium]|nr:DUF2334 domain-containing protein [Eubacteriales bacterium]